MVAVTSSAIAIEWSTLTAGSQSLSFSDHSSGSGEVEEGESEKEEPQDYLDEALERQGLDKVPNRMKESWIEDGYKYEVRVHEANPEYEKKAPYIVCQEKNKIGYQWTRIWNRVFGFKWCMASYKYIKTAKPRI